MPSLQPGSKKSSASRTKITRGKHETPRHFRLWSFAELLVYPPSPSNVFRLPATGSAGLPGQLYDSIHVPSSYRPVGTARLVRSHRFSRISATGQRVILRFRRNRRQWDFACQWPRGGNARPLCPPRFRCHRLRENRGQIKSKWRSPTGRRPWVLGPTAAWESSGGIIYDTYAEIHSDPYIENARLSYTLSPDFKSADCKLDVFVRGTSAQDVQLTADLKHERANVSHAQQTQA